MAKLTHPAGFHPSDRLRRFEGHMDTFTLVAIAAIGLTMLTALLLPGNLVPW